MQTRLEGEKTKLREYTDRKSELIERMKEEYEKLQNKIKEIVINPVFNELPIEINVFIESEDKEMQTDGSFFEGQMGVIEVPVEINIKEQL